MEITLNNYALNVNIYKIDKKAKIYAYQVPNANRSVLLLMGSTNPTYHIESIEYPSTNIELLVAILISGSAIQLIDVESNIHSVYVVDFKIDHSGGQPDIYNVVIDLQDINN